MTESRSFRVISLLFYAGLILEEVRRVTEELTDELGRVEGSN